jgi:hypothetical protein
MTVEQAIKDWYAYMTGDSSSERLRPGGFEPLTGSGGECENPHHEGYREVEKALKGIDVGMTKEWVFMLMSGGTKADLHNKAESLRVALHVRLRENLASKERLKEFEKV